MALTTEKCLECGKEFKKGDIVTQHIIENEKEFAMAGFNSCKECAEKNKYRYVKNEVKW